MEISFNKKTVTECLQQKFKLPTYQRDYKWETKHLQELLTDVQESFLASRLPAHGRKDVLGYGNYFLGTFITTTVEHGNKAIIDGQQRITTLTLLLAYAFRLAKKDPSLKFSPVEPSIRRSMAGSSQFNLDMDTSRAALFDLLIDGTLDDDALASEVDSIPNKDHGTVRLWELYQLIDSLLAADIKDNALLPHFFDYLTERVCMFEIGVPAEQDGHKVFVTMNDRGLKLSPIDLLKGFLLASISTNEQNQQAHEAWTLALQKLKALGSDEDSSFFKTWIRARYANSSRGKKRGDAAADFELIGDSYHRWVMDHRTELGLRNSDDFFNLITGTLPFYVDLYCRVKAAEKTPNPTYPHVFFNGARDLTLQAMVIISSVKETDVNTEATKKIQATSYFLDYLATVRVLNGKENTYDNVRDLLFEIAKEVRDLDSASLKTVLISRVDSDPDKIDNIGNVTYNNVKRQDLLHLLARLSEFLEEGLEAQTKVGFANYVDRSRDQKTFDIEHLIADNFTSANADLTAAGKSVFSSVSDFNTVRNGVGGLILLPRGRNRSMKAMPYSAKLDRYAGENALAQTLTTNFYLNQPNWAKFSAQTSIVCEAIPAADSAAVASRLELYKKIAHLVWSKDRLEHMF